MTGLRVSYSGPCGEPVNRETVVRIGELRTCLGGNRTLSGAFIGIPSNILERLYGRSLSLKSGV